MAENSKDPLISLTQQMGFNLLATMPHKTGAKTEALLQNLIQAVQKRLHDRALLLSLIRHRFCPKDAGSKVEEIVEPYAPGEPGFSNNLLASGKLPSADKVTVTMARLDITAAIVYKDQMQDENYMRHIINEDVARNVVTFCEDQIINGDGSKIAGLLHDSHDTIPIINKRVELFKLDFYSDALERYTKIAGRAPSLIALPNKEVMMLANLHTFQDVQGITDKLFGIPVMASDYLPGDRGLILAVDEISLASSNLELKFECDKDTLNDRERVQIIVGCNMGLLLKRPEAIARLKLARQ